MEVTKGDTRYMDFYGIMWDYTGFILGLLGIK